MVDKQMMNMSNKYRMWERDRKKWFLILNTRTPKNDTNAGQYLSVSSLNIRYFAPQGIL